MSKAIILLQAKYDWAKSKWWNVLFLTFAGVFSLLTFKTLLDIFALIACTSLIFAFFMTKENTIRKVALVSYCASICNTLSKFFVVALIADITALISVIISLKRYSKKTE